MLPLQAVLLTSKFMRPTERLRLNQHLDGGAEGSPAYREDTETNLLQRLLRFQGCGLCLNLSPNLPSQPLLAFLYHLRSKAVVNESRLCQNPSSEFERHGMRSA